MTISWNQHLAVVVTTDFLLHFSALLAVVHCNKQAGFRHHNLHG